MKTKSQFKLLTVCICMAQQSYALELIKDQDLGSVTGQDGIIITHEISKAEVNQVNWYDPNPISNTKMGLGLHHVKIEGIKQKPIISTFAMDVGATEKGAGLRLEASVDPLQLKADLNIVKNNCNEAPCVQSKQNLGELGIDMKSPFNLVLRTTSGLFNKDSKTHINFQLKNTSISHSLNSNSLILNDFNFNFEGEGYMYVDAKEGVVLATSNGIEGIDKNTVNLNKVGNNPGVNIDFRYSTPSNERKNIIRMGASGAVTNAKIFLNADQAGIKNFGTPSRSSSSTSYSELGSGGLHFGVAADFLSKGHAALKPGQMPTTLEIGHTGTGSYAIEFSRLRALTQQANASINFGDIYINTIQKAKTLDFVINKNMQDTLAKASPILAQTLNNTTEGGDFALIAIRGMDFQTIASRARFISQTAPANNDTGTWGIGIPIYNLNANLALTGATYGTEHKKGISYNLMASTDGYGVDGPKGPSTTSMILIDGHNGVHGEAVNYYAGLRNIDTFIESQGVIGYEDEGIYVRADKLLFAANAEIAVGQLPGSKYNCASSVSAKCNGVIADDIFAKKEDVLNTLAFKLDGKGELMIIPGVESINATPETNFLSLKANFEFTPLTESSPEYLGSYISLSTEDTIAGVTKKSSLNLNKLQGHVGLNGQIYLKENAVALDTQVQLNYKSTLSNRGHGVPFKAEMAMSPSGTIMQKIADIAITGGTLRSTLGITPR